MNKKELLLDWREIKFLQNIIICESCSGDVLGEPLRIIPLFGTGTQEWIQPIPVDGSCRLGMTYCMYHDVIILLIAQVKFYSYE